METLLSLIIGIGLSAACGFRIFVPLTIVSIAARTGHLTLAQNFAWMSSDTALVAFSVATALEIAAYYVPWLDNLLDSIASPAAVVAGTILTASLVSNVDPFLQWTLAVIAGGTAAGLVQAGTVVARGASTLATGGLGNPLIATAELGGSVVTSALVVIVPIVGALLALGIVGFVGYRFIKRKPATAAPPVLATASPSEPMGIS